jgi:hypothetical protein
MVNLACWRDTPVAEPNGFFVGSAWALVGGFSTLDSGAPLWLGTTIGGLTGVFFGLVFGG